MTPREQCLAAIEVSRILSQLWLSAKTDHERNEFEAILVLVHPLVSRLCKAAGLPV